MMLRLSGHLGEVAYSAAIAGREWVRLAGRDSTFRGVGGWPPTCEREKRA